MLATWLVTLIVLAGVVWGIAATARHEKRKDCLRRWEDSGLRSRHKPGVGCLVEVAPGRWVLEDKVQRFPVQ